MTLFDTFIGLTPDEIIEAVRYAEQSGWSPHTREEAKYGVKRRGQPRKIALKYPGHALSTVTIIDLANDTTAIEFDEQAAAARYMVIPTRDLQR
jgi:hypothetical protein